MLTDQNLANLIEQNKLILTKIAQEFNVFVSFRTLPVGIPSLMSSLMPVDTPYGQPGVFSIDNVITFIGVYLLITLSGLLIGTYYYNVVSQAVIEGGPNWIKSIVILTRRFPAILGITLLMVIILFAASIPLSCIMSVSLMGGGIISIIGFLIYGNVLLWILIPAIVSTYGIFVFDYGIIKSIKEGIKTWYFGMQPVILYVLVVLFSSQLFDYIWKIPKSNSWLLLIGILGHAFIATCLLASSFDFYRNVNLWVNERIQTKDNNPEMLTE